LRYRAGTLSRYRALVSWKPNVRAGVDLKALPLSPLLGYVAWRLDGHSDV